VNYGFFAGKFPYWMVGLSGNLKKRLPKTPRSCYINGSEKSRKKSAWPSGKTYANRRDDQQKPANSKKNEKACF